MSTGDTRVRFQTVGCRLNQYETEKMAADLAPYGFIRAEADEPADLYIINTCTVTHRADKDCRYLARRARKDNPHARVVLVGCYVETDPDAITGLNEVDAVIGNSEKTSIADILPQRLPELFDGHPRSDGQPDLIDFHKRNRAWIKISDGCNQTCSFCLVTVVRGQLAPRPAEEIIGEIRSLVDHGYNEVVLTGVNIGYYQDSAFAPEIENFASLCRAILENTDLKRIRLSSIEPQTVTNELIDLCANADGRICRHWHIPLQSGSDRILRLMRRPYTQDRFLKKVEAVKKAIPGAIVGADIIAGFPSETDADFAGSLEVAESGLIDYLHVFSYSDRPGTAAYLLDDKVAPETIRNRVKELQLMSREHWADAHRRAVGGELEVICENRLAADHRYRAVADNYLKVRLPDEAGGGKQIYRVKVTEAYDDFADAIMLD